MQINWGEVVTQIIGFLIALIILRHFAWGPMLAMLEARRQKIQGEFDRIDATRAEIAAMKTDLELQLKQIENQARIRIQEAVAEGQKVAAEMTEKARAESHELVVRARDEILREQAKAQATLRDEMVRMVMAATEKVVSERLDDAKHRERISQFIDSLSTVAGSSNPSGGKR